MDLPATAYVLLWFPKPSETFVFDEAVLLARLGLGLRVFTLYGPLDGPLSPLMRRPPLPIERLGLGALPRVASGLGHWLRRSPRAWRDLWREIPWRRWRGWESSGENMLAFACGFELARRCRDLGVEHIHAPWARGAATAAYVASRLTGIPFSFTGRAHDLQPPDSLFREKLSAAAFMRCESRAALGHVARRFPDLAHKLVLTYNAASLLGRQPLQPRLRPPFRLLALGRMVEFKGLEHLLGAARLLADRGLDFSLTLAGDGPRRAGLERLARDLGLGGRVSFPGFLPHHRVPELLADADILVMPSVVDRRGGSDGLPTVILEAMALGLPVAATRVAGIGEVVQDGVTGRLTPPGDAPALARAIAEMTSDPAGTFAMAARARELVAELCHPQRQARRLLDLYRGAAGRAGPPQRWK